MSNSHPIKQIFYTASAIATFAVIVICIGCEPALNSVDSQNSDNSNGDSEAQIKDLTSELENAQQKLKTANDQIIALTNRLEASEKNNQLLNETVDSINKRFKDSNSKLSSLVDEMKAIESDISSLLPDEAAELESDNSAANQQQPEADDSED